MVLRVGADGACCIVLLQTTQDMGESLTTRNSPITGTVLGTHVRSPFALEFLRNVRRIDCGVIGQVGQFECG